MHAAMKNMLDEVAATLEGTYSWLDPRKYAVRRFLGMESPIEVTFFYAFQLAARLGGEVLSYGNEGSNATIDIRTQAVIENFRVDFLIESLTVPANGRKVRLVVECDGHDFHERTKEQAARDRGRDRRLQELDYGIFRFTGSEIHNAPFACATKVIAWINDKSIG